MPETPMTARERVIALRFLSSSDYEAPIVWAKVEAALEAHATAAVARVERERDALRAVCHDLRVALDRIRHAAAKACSDAGEAIAEPGETP